MKSMRISRAELCPGAPVTTMKNTVDHVVTEYGVAELRGRSIAQRVRALIEIAHPKFRDELTREAREALLEARSGWAAAHRLAHFVELGGQFGEASGIAGACRVRRVFGDVDEADQLAAEV